MSRAAAVAMFNSWIKCFCDTNENPKKEKKCIRDYAECWMRQAYSVLYTVHQICSNGSVDKKYELNHLYFRVLDVDIISLLSCSLSSQSFFDWIFVLLYFIVEFVDFFSLHIVSLSLSIVAFCISVVFFSFFGICLQKHKLIIHSDSHFSPYANANLQATETYSKTNFHL